MIIVLQEPPIIGTTDYSCSIIYDTSNGDMRFICVRVSKTLINHIFGEKTYGFHLEYALSWMETVYPEIPNVTASVISADYESNDHWYIHLEADLF